MADEMTAEQTERLKRIMAGEPEPAKLNPLPLPSTPVSLLILEVICAWEVKLSYFKESGKYYSDGTYTSYKRQITDIFAEVKALLASGTRPGLTDGINHFYVVVEVPSHPNAFPCLIMPTGKEEVPG